MAAEIQPMNKSLFNKQCWRCWPQLCKCPPAADEVEQLKSERIIAERAYVNEKSRRTSAEHVINQILLDHGSGELSLSSVVKAAKEHIAKHSP